MSFDPGSLLLSLVIGLVGLALFIYGKKQQRMPQLIAGIVYMVYPYFTPDVTWTLVVGAVVGAALWWAVRNGW